MCTEGKHDATRLYSPPNPLPPNQCHLCLLLLSTFLLCQMEPAQGPRIAKSLAMFLSTLLVPDSGFRLPEKENIAPNQHTWLETAAQMGENCRKKCCHGKELTAGLTAQHIGEPNRKRSANEDLYVACSCRCQYLGACQGRAPVHSCYAASSACTPPTRAPSVHAPLCHSPHASHSPSTHTIPLITTLRPCLSQCIPIPTLTESGPLRLHHHIQ